MTADVTARLDRLDAARAAGTAGPWARRGRYQVVGDISLVAETNTVAHAALIVAAVNALPDLIRWAREREALRRAVLALADELDAAAQLPVIDEFDRGVAAHQRDASNRIRAAVTEALGVER